MDDSYFEKCMTSEVTKGRGGSVRAHTELLVHLLERRTPTTKYKVSELLGVHHRQAHRYLIALFEQDFAEPDTLDLHTGRPWLWTPTPRLIQRISAARRA